MSLFRNCPIGVLQPNNQYAIICMFLLDCFYLLFKIIKKSKQTFPTFLQNRQNSWLPCPNFCDGTLEKNQFNKIGKILCYPCPSFEMETREINQFYQIGKILCYPVLSFEMETREINKFNQIDKILCYPVLSFEMETREINQFNQIDKILCYPVVSFGKILFYSVSP